MAVSDRARRGDLYGNRMAGELVVGHQVIERPMKVASTVADGLGDKLKSLLQRRRIQDRECAADQAAI